MSKDFRFTPNSEPKSGHFGSKTTLELRAAQNRKIHIKMI